MGNILFSLALLVLGVVYYVGASRVPRNAFEDPVGSSGYPMLLAVVVILLAVAHLVQSTVGLVKARRLIGKSSTTDDSSFSLPRVGAAAALFATIVVFLAIFEVAGYLVAVTLFLLAVMLQRGAKFSWVPIATAIGGAVVFSLFFGEVLGVRLPVGLLGMPF